MKKNALFKQGDTDKHRRTIRKPKDWAHVKPSEGRTGKPKRAKPIKLKHMFWSPNGTRVSLQIANAGLPESGWTITSNRPARVLTSIDICRIYSYQDGEDFEVKYSDEHKVIEFQDLTHILTGYTEPTVGGSAEQVILQRKQKPKK